MTYELNIEPKAERFLKKLKKKNSYATSGDRISDLGAEKGPIHTTLQM
jgi:mRNA-degrading endonuclease RelE of RelBE toxin-antitoxin system